MDDRQLDDLLDHAAKHWRVPADPPLDEIWTGVVREAFDRPASRRAPGWATVGIAAAAALVIGAFGGRYSVRPVTTAAANQLATVPMPPATVADPNHRAMSELVGRTAVLLAALPSGNGAAAVDSQVSRESARLLTTTRLLLDSPISSDLRLRNLLQDLELVLAQVARLEPSHHRDEMQFIRTALDEHDIVPRLRTVAADLSPDDL
jgi:hypothetical protein